MGSCGDEFLITWKIENFSCLPHQTGERLTSAEFIVEGRKKFKLELWLYPRGYGDKDDKGKDHISIFLCNLENSLCTAQYRFSLETTIQPIKAPNWEKIEKSSFGTNGTGIFNVISLSELLKKKHLYLPQDVLTVKCWILPSDEDYKAPIHNKPSITSGSFRRQCFTITRTKVQKKYLPWPIKEIKKHIQNRLQTTKSLNGALAKTPSLTLSFSISEDSNEEYAQIEILPTHSPYEGKRLFVKCKMSIVTGEKISPNSIEDTHLFNLKLADKWIFPSFIKTKDLTDEKYLYVDDTLLLQCDFSFTCLGTEFHVEAPQYSPWQLEVKKTSKVNQLCGSIHHFYTSGDLCDVTLHADGKTFPAHRLVLCARSTVFSAMFQNDMKEKDTNVIDIVDVDAETLDRFLKFLHSDIMNEDLTSEEACNLYKAADKYQVDLLKRQCSILLQSALSVSSVCDVIVLADAHQDRFLMSAVNNFLHCHPSETFNSKEWKDFMDRCPKLSGIVMFKAWKSKTFL